MAVVAYHLLTDDQLVGDWSPIDQVVALNAAAFGRKPVVNRSQCMCDWALNQE